MLIDTHSHIYDEAFDDDRKAVVERAQAEGVERVVLPAIDGESNERLFDMCREYGDYVVPLMVAISSHASRVCTTIGKSYIKAISS